MRTQLGPGRPLLNDCIPILHYRTSRSRDSRKIEQLHVSAIDQWSNAQLGFTALTLKTHLEKCSSTSDVISLASQIRVKSASISHRTRPNCGVGRKPNECSGFGMVSPARFAISFTAFKKSVIRVAWRLMPVGSSKGKNVLIVFSMPMYAPSHTLDTLPGLAHEP